MEKNEKITNSLTKTKTHPSPSSSPSSYSDPVPVVDLSCGIFHSCLKTFLYSKSFIAIYPFLGLISRNYDQSLFGSVVSAAVKSAQLAFSVHYNIVILYLLTYLAIIRSNFQNKSLTNDESDI